MGGRSCGRDARPADARLRLLAGKRSLSTARRVARGICVHSLSFLFLIATVTDPRAQTQAGPQTTQPVTMTCHGARQIRQVAELLFGRDVGHRLGVGDSAFTHFVAREITPRFPDGLTVSDAIGQWRDRGSIIHEPSKRVEIVLPGTAEDDARLDAIAAAYKRRFHQQSVAIIVRPAFVSF
jgi:hypothetical protein